MKSHLVERWDGVKCAGHSDDTRAQLCGEVWMRRGEETGTTTTTQPSTSSQRIFKLAKELFHAHFEMGGHKNREALAKNAAD